MILPFQSLALLKVSSYSLGKRWLVFKIHKASLTDKGDLFLQGKTTDPVIWNLRILVEKDDLKWLIPLMLQREAIDFILSSLLSSYLSG